MSLSGVKISEEIWLSCLNHALSTETEEVLGLLLGDIKEDKEAGTVEALVWGAVPQARVDRRKDRVETTPEQLAAASAHAERMSEVIGKRTRVIGWYHSHPHITVLPSHIDVRSQGTYQMLEPGFVGLIFSCFNDDANNAGRIQTIAFQSVCAQQNRNGAIQFASAQLAGNPSPSTNTEIITVDESPASLRLMASENHSSTVENDDGGALLSPGVEQVIQISSLDISSSRDFIRKEIGLEVVPVESFELPNLPPDPLHALQQTLFDEEKAAYTQAMSKARRNKGTHPLASLHHSVTYQASLSRLLEFCLSPAMTSLYDTIEQNKAKVKVLEDEARSLELARLFPPNKEKKEEKGPEPEPEVL